MFPNPADVSLLKVYWLFLSSINAFVDYNTITKCHKCCYKHTRTHTHTHTHTCTHMHAQTHKHKLSFENLILCWIESIPIWSIYMYNSFLAFIHRHVRDHQDQKRRLRCTTSLSGICWQVCFTLSILFRFFFVSSLNSEIILWLFLQIQDSCEVTQYKAWCWRL